MPFSTQLTRANLHIVFVALVVLIMVPPVSGAAAPQENNQREHPPKLLNYSKMTTRQLVNEGEKIIFGGLGLAKVQGAVGRGNVPSAMRPLRECRENVRRISLEPLNALQDG